MAAVMIGVDPHKASHTAVAISVAEEPLGELRVRACAAQAERLLAWAAQARTRSSPSGSSAALIATAVCEALCGSIPIITAMNGPFLLVPGEDRGGHA